MSDLFESMTLVSSYSRADALSDGTLIDITRTAREAGITFPVAITREAWDDAVAWDKTNGAIQDEAGRLWDVVWMLRAAIRSGQHGQVVRYSLYRVPNTRRARTPRLLTLKAVCGPGDDACPVITIMGIDQD